MAITITERFIGSIGGKRIATYRLVHDGSVLTVTAGSMGFNRIETILGAQVYASMQTPASAFLGMQFASIGTDGAWIGFSESDANGKTDITLLGW